MVLGRAVERVLLRRAIVRGGKGDAGISGDGERPVAPGRRDVVVFLGAVERVTVTMRGPRLVVPAAAAHERDGETAENAHDEDTIR